MAALLDADETAEAGWVIDAGGRHVIPGLIDTHIHLGNYGQTFAEDGASGSRAAATGGVTAMLVYVVTRSSYDDVLLDCRRAVEE